MTLEIALSALSVVQGAQSGEGWSCDEVTYPAGLDFTKAPNLNEWEIGFAYFEYNIADWVGDGHDTRATIYFTLQGGFSADDSTLEPSTDDETMAVNRVMKNCHVRLHTFDSPSRAFDAFTMQADALDTPYGDANDPRIRWHVHGRFDPASFGDVDYDVTLELDQWGQLKVIGTPHLNDTGHFSQAAIGEYEQGGFWLTLLQQ